MVWDAFVDQVFHFNLTFFLEGYPVVCRDDKRTVESQRVDLLIICRSKMGWPLVEFPEEGTKKRKKKKRGQGSEDGDEDKQNEMYEVCIQNEGTD